MHGSIPHLAAVACGALLAACGGDGNHSPDGGGGAGTVQVAVTTSGREEDPDGYTLSEDGGAAQPIAPAQTLTVSDVAPGNHRFLLGGIADNCTVAGADPVTVTVAAGDTVQADFAVHCAVPGHIVFDIDGDLVEIASDGSGQTHLTSGSAFDAGAAWSRDGTRIAFGSDRMGGGIFVMNADGSGITRVTTDPSDGDPTWSPDGSRLAFVSRRDSNDQEIYAANLDGSNLVRLTTNPGPDEKPAWSPDGAIIVFTRGVAGSAHLYTMRPDGTGVAQLTDGDADVSAAWSPDGSKIAFRGTPSGLGGDTQILTINADGTDRTNLTNNQGFNFDPCWSPDGRALAYVSEVGGSQEVWVMNADGSDQTSITHNSTFTGRPTWGP